MRWTAAADRVLEPAAVTCVAWRAFERLAAAAACFSKRSFLRSATLVSAGGALRGVALPRTVNLCDPYR